MNPSDDIIDAFLDGEPVDPGALAGTLAREDARERLVDLLVLRGLVRSDAAVEPVNATPSGTGSRRRSWLAAAAAMLVAGTAAGFGLGWRAANETDAPRNGAADGPTIATTVRAPEPTEVIRLEPGIDWSERTW